MHAHFGLACAGARFEHYQTLHATLYLVLIFNFDDQTLRWLLLWETCHARTFWASVCACTLQKISNFLCNLRIGSSPFSILVTKLSECSFCEKRAMHARFVLACAHACSENFQTLCATLEFVYLHFLFWWPNYQIAPSIRNEPYTHVLGYCAHVHAPNFFKLCMQP